MGLYCWRLPLSQRLLRRRMPTRVHQQAENQAANRRHPAQPMLVRITVAHPTQAPPAYAPEFWIMSSSVPMAQNLITLPMTRVHPRQHAVTQPQVDRLRAALAAAAVQAVVRVAAHRAVTAE